MPNAAEGSKTQSKDKTLMSVVAREERTSSVRRDGGLCSAEILWTRGLLQVRTSALFGAKILWCVRTDERGRKGQFFAILCGRPLWMALMQCNNFKIRHNIYYVKGALNPKFLILTINNRKILSLETLWSHFLTCFC